MDLDLIDVIATDMLRKRAAGKPMTTFVPPTVLDNCNYLRTSINKPVMRKIAAKLSKDESILSFELTGASTLSCTVRSSNELATSYWDASSGQPIVVHFRSYVDTVDTALRLGVPTEDAETFATLFCSSYQGQSQYALPGYAFSQSVETLGQTIILIETMTFCTIQSAANLAFYKLVWTEGRYFERLDITS